MSPFLVAMAKIIKHTFEIPNLSVENGELVEGKPTTKTYTFTLLYRGVGLFEEVTGAPLINTLMAQVDTDKDELKSATNMMKREFIQSLAAVSYVKLDGDKFHNNRSTVEEFKKSPVYPLVDQDINFIAKLMSMALECISGDKQVKQSGEKRSKK